MYKVVVVEDEEIARKGIIFTINWDALNCMIAGEAANGEDKAVLGTDHAVFRVAADAALKLPAVRDEYVMQPDRRRSDCLWK